MRITIAIGRDLKKKASESEKWRTPLVSLIQTQTLAFRTCLARATAV
jgi:hypothetical protein